MGCPTCGCLRRKGIPPAVENPALRRPEESNALQRRAFFAVDTLMLDYRLYFLDSTARHIERFEPITAVADADALEIAAEFLGRWPMELWLRDRHVKSFPAQVRGDSPCTTGFQPDSAFTA
jgi:hypothetical protein